VTPEDSMFGDSMATPNHEPPSDEGFPKVNVQVEVITPEEAAARAAERAAAALPFDLQTALLIYGCGTFAVLFLAWAVPRFTFLGIDRVTGAPPMVACDPPPPPEARRAAWRFVILNWLVASIPIMAMSPALWFAFPKDVLAPVWWQIIMLYTGGIMTHDMLVIVDRHTIGVARRIFQSVTSVPKLLQGPFAWGGRCVHPAEMYYQVLDLAVVPLLWTFFWRKLSLYVWWGWAAILQFMWVLERSNYSPSETGIMELLGLRKRKNRRSNEAAREGAKAAVGEAEKSEKKKKR